MKIHLTINLFIGNPWKQMIRDIAGATKDLLNAILYISTAFVILNKLSQFQAYNERNDSTTSTAESVLSHHFFLFITLNFLFQHSFYTGLPQKRLEIIFFSHLILCYPSINMDTHGNSTWNELHLSLYSETSSAERSSLIHNYITILILFRWKSGGFWRSQYFSYLLPPRVSSSRSTML